MEGIKTLLIVDADFLLYSATMGKKVFDEFGDPVKEDNKFVYIPRTENEVYDCADQIITTLVKISKSDYYVGYLGGCKSFRYNVYPEYKGNRKGIKPDYFKELQNYLYKEWNFIRTDNGLEADDAVNIARNNLQNDFDCTIATSDKDLIKSIAGKYINTRDLKIIHTSEEEANIFFWKSMICGDVIDNIKGLVGRGEKYADKIISLCEELNTGFAMEVLNQYILHYKDLNTGIEEFYKNYKCLKILDTHTDFSTPEPIKFNREEKVEW